METIVVYIPRPQYQHLVDILPGSGIASIQDDATPTDAHILIDFEGNKFGSESFKTWADRVHHAYDRQSVRYPTIARAVAPRDELVAVGTFDPVYGRIQLAGDADLVDVFDWLGLADDADLAEQLLTTSRTHQDVRTVATWTPEQRRQLRHLPGNQTEHYRKAGLI